MLQMHVSRCHGIDKINDNVRKCHYRIRVKFGGELNLTVWRSVLELPILMSANYFNLRAGQTIPAGNSLNYCQELLTIDGDKYFKREE